MYKSLLRFILDSQNDDGSFGRDTEASGNILSTAQVLSLIESDADAEHNLPHSQLAIDFLRGQQHVSGKWTNTKSRPRETSMTASVVRAFRQAGVAKSDSSLERAASWLLGKQKSSGEFVESDVVMRVTLYSHTLTLGALAELGLDHETVCENGIHWLRLAQNEDGGFGMRRGDASHSAVTSYVILAIRQYRAEFVHTDNLLMLLQSQSSETLGQFLRTVQHTLGEKAAVYLARVQSDIGEWSSWVVDDFQVEGIAAGLAAYRLVGHNTEVINKASRLLMYRLGNLSWAQVPIWQLALSAEALRTS